MDKYYLKRILVLILLSYIFLMWGNGILNLTNPDEVFYTQTAKEMIRHQSWLTPYLFGQPQFEKPIFTYWLLKFIFTFFGISNFTARFFPALFAMAGVVAVYALGLLAFKEEKKAFLSGLILMSSGLYIGLARTVFTDMIFSVLILWALLSFFWGYSRKNRKKPGLILFFFFTALAVLTKGPLGLMIPLLIIASFLLVNQKELRFLFCKEFLGWGFFTFMIIALPWYMYILSRYGHGFIQEFFYNDHIRRFLIAEHSGNDTWYFYPAAIIGCLFPWSILMLCALAYLIKRLREGNNPFHLFLICWIAVVFLVFQASHSKLISYILPLVPAFPLIIADFIYSFIADTQKRRFVFAPFLITAISFLIISVGLGIGTCLFMSGFAEYVSLRAPLCTLSLLWFILAILLTILAIRHKYAQFAYLLACYMLAFFGVFPFAVKGIAPFVSSKDICAYLLKDYKDEGVILCAKPFVRGVRYYTDKPVAVYGSNFFSPHPVPCVSTDEEVTEFLQKQPITFAVLTKSTMRNIVNLIENQKGLKCILLKTAGNEYLLKINHDT